MQNVDSWVRSDTEDKKAGGLYKYGSSAYLGSDKNPVPAADGTHTGNALGIVAVWTGTAQYTQTAKTPLVAGTYTITVDVYNQAGTIKPTKSLIGFISDAGVEYLAPASAYTVGSWQTVTYTFVLNEATAGKFSLGMTSANKGNADSPHFFFDNLKLTYTSGNAELDANTKKVEGATPETPVVTDFVKNGTFDSNVDSWISTTNAQNRGLASNQTGAFTGNFYENWNQSAFTGKMCQQVKNIPNGTYKLKICAFVSTLDAANQHVYANSDQVALTAGEPTAYEVWTVVTDNTVEVGLEQTAASNNWMGIDNISLTYYGEGDVREAAQAAAHKTDYEAAKKEATADLAADTYTAITGSERTALQNAVNATVTETADGYDAAKTAITTAQSAFESAFSHYTAYNNIKAQAQATTELPYGSKTKFAALAELVKTATDPTSADDADSKVTAITKAIRAYVESNSVAEGVEGATSYTSSIKNPNAEATDGWTLAQGDGGGKIEVRTYTNYPNDPLIDSNGSSEYNYFDGGNWDGKDWTTKYEQVVKSLPAGKYLLAVSARGSVDLRWYRLYANDVTAKLDHVGANADAGVFGRGWNDGYLVFTTDGNSDVTIGVTANAQLVHQWQSFTRFRLTRIGDLDAVTISEDATTAPTASDGYVNVTLDRTFNANAWNTLVLPFDVTAKQVTSVFGDKTTVANFTGATVAADGNYTLNFATSTDGIEANVPVFIYGVSNNNSFVFNGVKVNPSAPAITKDDVSFTGFYTPTKATAGCFFISSDNKFYKAIGTETIKATRAVFTLPSSSSAKIASIQMDGTATGITAVNSNAKVDNTVYNVAGQRVNNSYKGLVIVNGKKVLRK